MAGRHPVARESGRGGERHGPLRDPATRVGGDGRPGALQGVPVGLGSDDDALAARTVHRLDHQLVDLVEDGVQLARFVRTVGLDVRENGLLAEVVPDQIGYVRVEEFVVGDAVAHGVGERDGARLGGAEDARAADHRIGPEVQRIEEVVVEPSVYDMHRHLAPRGPHPDTVVTAGEIVPLDQLHPHQPCQQGVFEVGGVAGAGREDDDPRVADPVGRGGAQGRQKSLRVAVHGDDVLFGEEGRKDPGHRAPVLDDVRDPGRHADVVLQDTEVPGLVPYEIDAGDVDPYAAGWLDPVRRTVEMGELSRRRQGTTPSSKARPGP